MSRETRDAQEPTTMVCYIQSVILQIHNLKNESPHHHTMNVDELPSSFSGCSRYSQYTPRNRVRPRRPNAALLPRRRDILTSRCGAGLLGQRQGLPLCTQAYEPLLKLRDLRAQCGTVRERRVGAHVSTTCTPRNARRGRLPGLRLRLLLDVSVCGM